MEWMKVITVSELTSAIKAFLEPNFRELRVQGEISNFKLQSSGHLYFSLKDAGSQVSSVLFKGHAAQLKRMPKEGDQVIARGEISLYAPRGQYQLVIRELEFLGVGELLLKLHQLKEALEKRGWFDLARKKKLPKIPKRIGVVTSPTGAVIQDILHVLTRRFSGFHVILNPVKVQGDGAKEEIAQAIYDFNKHNLADVLIVGRGGGSIEDLWAFNEEVVAQAIYESKIPVISAVGHETDFTIADWVADVRAPTPSAAAEIAISEKANLVKFLFQTENSLKQKIGNTIKQARLHLAALQRHPLLNSPYSLLLDPIQKLDLFRSDIEESFQLKLQKKALLLSSLKERLELLKPLRKISQMKERLAPYKEGLKKAGEQILFYKREKLKNLYEHLLSINPKNLLKKGYSVLFSEKGNSLILSAKDLSSNQKLSILMHDGKAHAIVNSVEAHDNAKSLF